MIDVYEMGQEVRNWAIEKGWRGDDAPLRHILEDCALMQSEVSEALEAYRTHGTNRFSTVDGDVHPLPFNVVGGEMETIFDDLGYVKDAKPEGVHSEIADVFIRVVETMAEHNLYADYRDVGGLIGRGLEKYRDYNFGAHMFLLSHAIDRIGNGVMQGYGQNALRAAFNHTLVTIMRLCEWYGIDIEAEYNRKMQYNATRTFRHGNKNL